MVERAREELEKLESLHPTRFNYLKLELKSLISRPHSYVVAVDEDSSSPPPATSTAPTQGFLPFLSDICVYIQIGLSVIFCFAVSCNRKRKTGWSDDDEDEQAEQRQKKQAQKPSESSVEMAVRRAEACLRRIQRLKHSLFC
ncbi:unnamed protein product [Musa textilis]